ncbi:unnamed protein product [Brachionus calyciflorus]|uniref:DDE-1 domain-containing protein n=1 Tax=Brachionus calyciflorus TaxID=104777 RepID=A0A814IGI1_9BILA|nr:unnamed protein product [Brachionus calyciflorus]
MYEHQIRSYLAFQTSDGWLAGWLKRHNKTFRHVTKTGRDLPTNYSQVISDLLNKALQVLRKHDFNRKKIFNMDETVIYLDCPIRISAIYTGSSDGEKLPFFLLVPRTKEFENYDPPSNIRIIYKTVGIFNEDTICDYYATIMNVQHNCTLYLDSARCHLTKKGREKKDELGIELIYTLPRKTNILQSADACWFSKIKKAYCTKWTEWPRNSPKNYTVHGNTKSPGYVLAIQWLSEIWENFESHAKKNLFDSCGITSQNDLHRTLKDLVSKNLVLNVYIDNFEEEEAILGFNENENEPVLQPQIQASFQNNQADDHLRQLNTFEISVGSRISRLTMDKKSTPVD